jgi:hypothetical protein
MVHPGLSVIVVLGVLACAKPAVGQVVSPQPPQVTSQSEQLLMAVMQAQSYLLVRAAGQVKALEEQVAELKKRLEEEKK